MAKTDDQGAAVPSIAELSDDLQALRMRAGDVSYGEIAVRIARAREEAGMPAARAAIARSTVYDAFRADRRRLNAGLVTEIVLALGGTEDEAESWRRRCLAARPVERADAASAPVAPDRAPLSEQPRTPPSRWPSLPPPHPDRLLGILLFVACVQVNLLSGVMVVNFHLPIFLDMVGTAIVAVCFGPWRAAAVGVLTIGIGSLATSPDGIPFVLVTFTGAMVWGYGIHRWGWGRSPARFLLLNVVAGTACSLTSLPLTVLLYSGRTEHTSTVAYFDALSAAGLDPWLAAFGANIGPSLLDKLIAGYAALGAAMVLLRQAGPSAPAFSGRGDAT